MNPPTFTGETDRDLAYGLHLLALTRDTPAVVPGYARSDGRLRVAARVAPVTADPGAVPDFESLLAGTAAPATLDAAWFARRWDGGGERDTTAHDAARAATEASATPHGGLLAGRHVAVLASTTLRAGAWPLAPRPDPPGPRHGRVLVGFGTPGAMVVLATIAGALPTDPRLDALPAEDRAWVRLQCAGSVLAVTLGDSPEIGTVLEAVADVLLPPQHQGDRVLELIGRFRDAGLFDQPPGEIERLGQGLARRYSDRLHRAWLRGFFVPRGGDPRAWADALMAP